MAESGQARPRQVTMAATFAIIGSLVLIFSLADMLGQLRTPETREQVEELLSEPPLAGLGVEVAQVVDVMRVLVYVAAALAAAIFVLAIYVLQRHRAARVVLTVAAALLLLTTPVAGLLPMLVGIAAVMLWSAPARDWFAGRSPSAVHAAPSHRADHRPGWGEPGRGESDQRHHEDHVSGPDLPPVVPPPATPTATDAPAAEHSQPPPAPRPFGAPSSGSPASDPEEDGRPGDHPGPYDGRQTGQYAGQGYWPAAAAPTGGPRRRPWTVTLAAVLTWVGSAVAATGMLAFMAVLAFDSDTFVDEFDRAAEGTGVALTHNQVMAAGWAVGALFLLWSLTAAVLAVMAFRRSQAGRIGLVVSAVATATVSLLAILSIVPVLTLLMSGATVVLLFTGGANDWYAHRDVARPFGPGGPGPGAGPGQGAPPGHAPYPPAPKQKVEPW